jgi:hypothetical protein
VNLLSRTKGIRLIKDAENAILLIFFCRKVKAWGFRGDCAVQSRTLGLIFCVSGSLTLAFALVTAIFNYDFLQNALTSQGTVGQSATQYHCPIRFKTPEYNVQVVVSGLRPHAPGEKLTVLYLPHTPSESKISGEEWDVPCVAAMIGAIHLIAGVLGVFGCITFPDCNKALARLPSNVRGLSRAEL